MTNPGESAEITRLLKAWGRGDGAALDRLTPLVYERLHRMARGYMRSERAARAIDSSRPSPANSYSRTPSSSR